jgi:predicted sugar kinase
MHEAPESYNHDPSHDWTNDYWKRRFTKVYQPFRNRDGVTPIGKVNLELAPVPHEGLGSGTQFACAASAILNAQLADNWTDIIIDSGRGLRSHIGLHGFLHGQLIVDQGQTTAGTSFDEPRTLVQSFPDQWRIVLVHEDVYQGDSGDNEQSIFDACSKQENPNRDRMLELIDKQILPSLHTEDYQRACQAIGEYGELAGEIFAPALGDSYRSPRIRYWVDRIRSLGFQGVGQSSWGPVVFVIVQDCQQAQWLLSQIQADLLDGSWTDVCTAAGPAKIQSAIR